MSDFKFITGDFVTCDNFPRNRGKLSYIIAWKVIFKLNWTKIFVYFNALQCKEVQSSIEKFHWSKKSRETFNLNEKFYFNLNIRVPLKSVDLFLHVFLCLMVILTIKQHINSLTIVIWKFAIFWSWQLALWILRQLAPASFFLNFNSLRATMLAIFILLISPRIR